jgi:hypothetical protein
VVTFILQGIAENQERTQAFWLYLIVISGRLFIAITDASLNRKRDAFLAAKRLESVRRQYKLVSSLKLRHAAQTVFGIVVGFKIMHLVGITLPVTHMALSALALFTAVAMWLAIGAGVRRAVAVGLCVSIVTFLSWWNPVYAGQDQRQVLARNWGACTGCNPRASIHSIDLCGRYCRFLASHLQLHRLCGRGNERFTNLKIAWPSISLMTRACKNMCAPCFAWACVLGCRSEGL